jgi:hypothetical protein
MPMNDKEAIEMMERCMHELQELRGQINALGPKAEAYEVIRSIIGMLPKQSQGYSEDIVWRLKKKIAELQPKPKPEEDLI